MRHALAYVLNNARRHGLRLHQALDYFASGWWFDGWREQPAIEGLESVERPVTQAQAWLLRVGWRRHRLIDLENGPGG